MKEKVTIYKNAAYICREIAVAINETHSRNNKLHTSKQLVESAYKRNQNMTKYKMSSDSMLSLLSSENV